MLGLSEVADVQVFSHVTDMRKGFDSLSRLVVEHSDSNPLSGTLYVFFSRRRDRVKILSWEEDGYALYYKRLEVGRWRIKAGEAVFKVSSKQLRQLLSGTDFERIKFREKVSKQR